MILEKFIWAKHYFEYLDLRSKGIRQKALKKLNQFLEEFKKQEIQKRREFINAVNLEVFITKDFSKYLPFTLSELFKSEINDWQIEEPNNPIAFKWTYNFDDLKKSIKLDSGDLVTLEILSVNVINKIVMNQHEVDAGFGYQGDPGQDLTVLNSLKPLLENMTEEEKKARFIKTIENLEEIAKKFVQTE